MSGNIYGTLFRLATYGESHGPAIGGVIDGCPAGIKLDLEAIQNDLDRRKPGQSAIVTQRKEPDEVRFYSGIFEGKTTGTPIGFAIHNTNQKSKDYSHIKDSYRPSHADYVYDEKYGIRDYRGGGRSSARETASRVVAGAIAKQFLSPMSIQAYVSGVGTLAMNTHPSDVDFSTIEDNPVRCPEPKMAVAMENYIKQIRKEGDTVGGIITCVIKNVPVGLGEPAFDKLHAELGKAMLSINAVKGFEYGSGFAGTQMKGSEHNDLFNTDGTTQTNRSGGIQGGISNGSEIVIRLGFKPVSTLLKTQDSVNESGEPIQLEGRGRHDPCVLPRAVPLVEAMVLLVLADHSLKNNSAQL